MFNRIRRVVQAFRKPPTLPMWREGGQDYVLGYMDRIGFECELGGASKGNRVFPSVEECKEHHKCWEQCGIVEVKVEATRIVEEGSLEEDLEDDS
jgi:hypothetical protein